MKEFPPPKKKKPGVLHSLQDPPAFRKALTKWFHRTQKNYPWRQTTDPYAILVSEVMLQQTTVKSVIANRRYELFLEAFPHVEALAAASEEQILRAWEGLGYYRRVRNLQKTAQAVLSEHEGTFPKNVPELLALPGVGPYTSAAVASFADDQLVPLVDGNVARVFARIFDDSTEIDSPQGTRQLWEWARALTKGSQHGGRSYNAALMELGQQICTLKAPQCHDCPVRDFCQCSAPGTLPRKKQKRAILAIEEHALWHIKGNTILLAQPTGGRREGFWQLPLREAETLAHLDPVDQSKYTITHHRVQVSVYDMRGQPKLDLQNNEEWVPLENLDQIPISTPYRKIIQRLS